MAPDTKTDGADPVFVLSSFEIARRLKERFANANQAGAAMPQFARALVYKMWEGGANVTQDTLLRFTEALEALDAQDEAEVGVRPQTADQTFEASERLVSGDDTPAAPRRAAAPNHGPAPAGGATTSHPGDDGLVIDTTDGDAPTPDTTDDTEEAV